MIRFFECCNAVLWGPASLVLYMGTGLYLLVLLKGHPIIKIGSALKLLIPAGRRKDSRSRGDISPFQSLMTSLAACIGTGNIAGVACAMVLGGPGALIWMNLSALTGLSTIFTENLLTMIYRRKDGRGEMAGGPMYVMEDGIGGRTGRSMAVLFSVFAIGASFGIGNMTQSNTAAQAVREVWHLSEKTTGILLCGLTFAVIAGGVRCIGKICGLLVPPASLFYIGACIFVIAVNSGDLKDGLAEMFRMAFSARAVSGGIGGAVTASMFSAMKWGIARGVFSNESGLGSSPIAAAAAKTDHPVKQAYIQMTGPVIDTMIMCTLTGLAISASGVLGATDSSGHMITGAALTIKAFSTATGQWAEAVIAICIAGFALPAIIGWGYYGEKAVAYLTGRPQILWLYRILYSLAAYAGAVRPLELVWGFSDMMNGLMALPNLICILLLSRQAKNVYFSQNRG